MKFGPYEIQHSRDIAGGGFDALATGADGKPVCLWVGAPGRTTTRDGGDPESVRAVLAKVYHASLPRPLRAEVVEDRAVMVLQPYEGCTLADRLREGPAEVTEAIDWVRSVAAALVKAHRAEVRHGAIEAGEILLADDGRVLLLHLGFAPFLGERAPRAPEDLEERGREVADVFGLSRVLLTAVLGSDGMDGDPREILGALTPREAEDLPATLPEGLRRLLVRSVHPEAQHRLHRAEELSGDLGVIRSSWDSMREEAPHPTVPFGLVTRPALLGGAVAVVLAALLLGLRAC